MRTSTSTSTYTYAFTCAHPQPHIPPASIVDSPVKWAGAAKNARKMKSKTITCLQTPHSTSVRTHTHHARSMVCPPHNLLPPSCSVWVFGLTSSFSSVSPVYARFLLSLEKCYYVPLALLAKLALPSYAVPPMPRHACHASPPAVPAAPACSGCSACPCLHVVVVVVARARLA